MHLFGFVFFTSLISQNIVCIRQFIPKEKVCLEERPKVLMVHEYVCFGIWFLDLRVQILRAFGLLLRKSKLLQYQLYCNAIKPFWQGIWGISLYCCGGQGSLSLGITISSWLKGESFYFSSRGYSKTTLHTHRPHCDFKCIYLQTTFSLLLFWDLHDLYSDIVLQVKSTTGCVGLEHSLLRDAFHFSSLYSAKIFAPTPDNLFGALCILAILKLPLVLSATAFCLCMSSVRNFSTSSPKSCAKLPSQIIYSRHFRTDPSIISGNWSLNSGNLLLYSW